MIANYIHLDVQENMRKAQRDKYHMTSLLGGIYKSHTQKQVLVARAGWGTHGRKNLRRILPLRQCRGNGSLEKGDKMVAFSF
jgi:hypothetical protein